MRTTWTLWWALTHPPVTHPMFQRASHDVKFPRRRLILLGVLIVLFGCVLPLLNPTLLALVFLAPLVFVVFNGTLYGSLLSAYVASSIAGERQRGNYEVLSLTPAGGLGAHWFIAVGCLHRNQLFDRLREVSVEEFFIAIMLALGISVERSQHYMNTVALAVTVPQITLILIYMTVLMTILFLNRVQSLVLSCAVGMLVPVYVQTRSEAQLIALGSYLTLQLAIYGTVLFLVTQVFPLVFALETIWEEAFMIMLALILFYAAHEVAIGIITRTLPRLLNATSAEWERLLHLRL